MDDAPKTLLVTLTGKDRPGVTSAMFAALAAAGVEVLDIEQIVLRRRLVLGILVTAPRDWKKLRDVIEQTAADLGMQVEVDRGAGDNRTRQGDRSHVTLIGSPLKASAMSAIAGRIADSGANIDRIERMARYPVTAIDLAISGAPAEMLRPLLAAEAVKQGIDIAVQRESAAPPRRPADRDGRRLHAHPGRGDRDDRRPRRVRGRGRARHRGRRCAASSTSRSRCAQRVALLKGVPAVGPRRGLRLDRARSRGPHDGADPAAAGLPLRDRLRRLQPDHRPAGRRPRHPLRPGQRARDRRRAADRPRSSGRSSTGQARPPRCASSPPTSGSRWMRPSPSATAPTTSTCSTRPASASPTTPSRWCATPPTPRSTCPTSTRSSTCSASRARRSRQADAEVGIVTPAPPLEQPLDRQA